MNYHSTLSTRTLMKFLGLGGIRPGSGHTGTADPTFLGACALALFTLTVQHFFASFAESEPRAA
jgi:histidinol-phosphate/aromatic aminotransferase/cobyric acid decarboxylase-like protein